MSRQYENTETNTTAMLALFLLGCATVYQLNLTRYVIRFFQLVLPSAITGFRSENHLHVRGSSAFLGSIPEFKEDLLNRLLQIGHLAKKQPSGIASLCLGPDFAVVTTKDEHIRQSSRPELSRNAAFPLGDFIGLNTFSATGEAWSKRHALEIPYLSIAAIRSKADDMNAIIVRECRRLENIHDLNEFMHTLVMKIILDSFYAVDPSKLDEIASPLAKFLKEITAEIISFPNMAKRRTPEPLRGFLYPEICAPDAVKKRAHDFLKINLLPHIDRAEDSMMNALMGEFGVEEALGDVFGILFASVDSTASTISFLLYELSKHPDILARLQNKTEDDFDQYLNAIVKEILLLYPAFPIEVRGVVKPFVLEGFPLKEGDTCFMLNPSLLESYTFDPERWLRHERSSAMFPAMNAFGQGPRACNGQDLAKQVIRLVAAQILKNYRLECSDTIKPTLNGGGSLKPDRAISMRFYTQGKRMFKSPPAF